MIFTDRTIIVQKGTSSINDTIILYRGDRDIEVRFTLNEGSPFKFGSGASPNIIEKTEAAYGQLIIKRPNDLPAVFSEIAPTNEGKIVFTITAEMIDEITEVGNYTFQIRLLDESRNSRATLPEVMNGIEIREPIASEDTTNEVGVATVGYALTTAGAPEDAFDSEGNYNKTTWKTGDRITAVKLNKIEAGIDGVNKKVASGGTGGGVVDSVDWSNVQNKPTIPTNTSQLTNDSGFITNVPDEYITESELNARRYASEQYVDDAVNNASISGGYTHPSTHPASMITGLSTVATSGSYNDLTDKPIIPTRTSELANNSDFVDSAFVSQKIAEASLSGGEVDLSGYVTKGVGNASQIQFADGQTFQAKLDTGTLKGEKGDQGEQGIQGLKGDKGDKGDKGEPGSNSIDDTTASATTTYSSNKIENIKEELNLQIRESVKSIKDFGAKCDGVTDDTMAFESALSSDSSVIKIPKGTMLIRQGQSYISHGVKKKVIGEEGSIIKCDFDSCKHFLNLSINVEFENVTFDFNNKNILNAITFSENVGLIRMKNITFQNVNDTDSAKSTVIVNITDGEVDIDNIKFKNMKKRGNGSTADGGGNLTCLGYFPSTERKGVIKNITIQNTHNVNGNNAIIFEDVSGVYVGGDATNRDILLVENINGYNFGKRLIKTQCSNIIIRDTYGFSDVGDSLSCVGVGDTSSQGDSEIAQSNIIVENFRAEGKIIAPISTSCKNVIFRNGFINTDACDMPGNTGGSRAFLVTGSDVTFDNIVASTNVIGFIDNHPHESLKNASGKNISFNNCSFTIKDANQVYGITTAYGKEALLNNIKFSNVDIIYGSTKMGIIDFSRGAFNNIDINNLNVVYPNVDPNFAADGIILDKCNNVTISDVNFKSNSVKGLFEGIKATQCTNLTIDNVATDQNDPENKCRLLNIQNSTGVSVSNIKKGNYKYLSFNTCQDVFLSDVDSSKISNINSSINMGGSGSGNGGSGTSYDDTEVRNDINNIKTALGTAELTTTAKNVKGAINEVVTRCTEIANEANSYFELAGERNLFGQDRYVTGYYIDYNSALDAFAFIKSSSGVGKIAIVEIKPNTQYSIVKGPNTLTKNNKTMFVYGTDSTIFNQGDRKRALDGLQARVYETHVTFTSTATDNYLYIYFSDDVNATDHIQVTEGETAEFLPSSQFYVPSDKLSVYSIDEAEQRFKRQDGTSKHITKFYIPSSKVPDYAILDCAYNELPDLTTFFSYADGLVDNTYVTKTVIGNEGSAEAYPINAYRFKPASPIINGKTKPQVIPKFIITACIHGEEKPSALALLNLCKNLKDNWAGNEFLTYLRFNVELIVIPILNPWGYVNNTRGNHNHVDLNRNFDYNWANQGSTDSTDERYRGTSANSENETQAIINFMNAEKNELLGHIDMHALGSGDTSWELLYRQELSNEKYEDVFLQIAASNLAEVTAKGISKCNVPSTVNTQLGKIGIGYDSAAIDNYFNSIGIISTCCEVAYKYVTGERYEPNVNKLNTYYLAANIRNFINTFLYM